MIGPHYTGPQCRVTVVVEELGAGEAFDLVRERVNAGVVVDVARKVAKPGCVVPAPRACACAAAASIRPRPQGRDQVVLCGAGGLTATNNTAPSAGGTALCR